MTIGVESHPPLALIAGPTASGKSALALALAERSNGVIVNADSAQLYRDLPILSAAPSEEESARAEHRLYGAWDGAQPCSAADWALRAASEIRDIQGSGRLPILVGGTGLYLRTLLDGIAPIPPIDPEIRAMVRTRSVEANREQLANVDPRSAEQLHAGDSTRIARALEVRLSTGVPLHAWQERREGGIGDQVTLRPLILLPPRNWLYKRCDERFERMIADGAAGEVESLTQRGLPSDLPVMRAIGVREVAAWLAGEIDREEAIRLGQQATRRYAKRQYTWFRHQPPAHWPRFEEPLSDSSMAAALAILEAKA